MTRSERFHEAVNDWLTPVTLWAYFLLVVVSNVTFWVVGVITTLRWIAEALLAE